MATVNQALDHLAGFSAEGSVPVAPRPIPIPPALALDSAPRLKEINAVQSSTSSASVPVNSGESVAQQMKEKLKKIANDHLQKSPANAIVTENIKQLPAQGYLTINKNGAVEFKKYLPRNLPAGSWALPLEGGGANIGGRWCSEHALERMAPNTPEVMDLLTARAIARVKREGHEPGTSAFDDALKNHRPDPRNIPPIIVEAEIADPGSTGIRVQKNKYNHVVTVYPKKE